MLCSGYSSLCRVRKLSAAIMKFSCVLLKTNSIRNSVKELAFNVALSYFYLLVCLFSNALHISFIDGVMSWWHDDM